MIQYIIAIALLLAAIFFLTKKFFVKTKAKTDCGDDCACH
jgi:hypothetical protein